LSVKEFEDKCAKLPSVYLHNEVLINSLEGHPMVYLTLTGIDEATKED